MEVTLPGGLWAHDQLTRSARFASFSGHAELALAELDASACSMPDFVTRALCLSLSDLGGLPPVPEAVEGLCVADRQFLMLRLAEVLNGDDAWLRARCSFCEHLFDLHIRRSALPVKEAEEGFPFCTVDSRHGRMRLRVPTGHDQKAIVQKGDEEAMRMLLASCVVSVDGKAPDPALLKSFSDEDVQAIEEALEALSPSVCDMLQTECPECGGQQNVCISPYEIRFDQQHGLFQEVHGLASYYHWSEQDILALPRGRRRLYLGMISLESGHGPEA